jgi:hypothetical protein
VQKPLIYGDLAILRFCGTSEKRKKNAPPKHIKGENSYSLDCYLDNTKSELPIWMSRR